ncbi:polysaccharide biosynthesis/export family protein [Geobacter sp.]|uniref:polysaccharide biosynthesis/export family protein n=1 Tax=Geobacter sp. TaxID=46610 RepID=UPI0027BAE9DF|nr:polysaccharide biosynthesis/export family protein [Geobacter sp.]
MVPIWAVSAENPEQSMKNGKVDNAQEQEYVIGDGDGLMISVWGVPELSVGVAVRPDGKITLPAIGDITASGYTPMKLAEKLTEKLKEVVKAPIVTVTVSGITNNKVYVIGGGVPPGINVLIGRTTLLKFMARFGSYKGADLNRAYIMRDGKKLDVNFYDLLIKGDLSNDPLLKAEDIIYVPDIEANKIYIMGAVNAPKFTYHREGYKILDAILEAGGMTKFASENSVLVQRKGSATVTVRVKDLMKDGDLSQNIYLMPGDFIIVKEGIF